MGYTTHDWVGVAYVTPAEGSEQEREGLAGGYGFVACRAETTGACVRALEEELLEGGTVLSGFEWLSRTVDNERELRPEDTELIARLREYPVQFKDFEWYQAGKLH